MFSKLLCRDILGGLLAKDEDATHKETQHLRNPSKIPLNGTWDYIPTNQASYFGNVKYEESFFNCMLVWLIKRVEI